MIFAPEKDPDATLDYSLDWTPWLTVGETVSAFNVTVPAGITLDGSGEAAGVISWRMSGGSVGVRYDVTVEVTTSSGQIDQRTVRVPVEER